MNVLIVCIANICRSPVAEVLLKHKLNEDFNISSAGVYAREYETMDPRSIKYLESKNLSNFFHLSKIISSKSLDSADIVLSLDSEIRKEIIRLFPRYTAKVFLLSEDQTIGIQDPYKLKDIQGYFRIMEEISEGVNYWAKRLTLN